ncbi:TetR/AcrR family transcriptional regulator [Williamsia herbipolensis]|uniref:TetR/AcrR family transcriptional regulator n=1 Tax=Williamsia herbipolensis TaxID=1603258 RepID=A0AAU4JZ46_9NOCA|nr:helix-turn-helix domain-containing protein [Williamsia herbipolensis]
MARNSSTDVEREILNSAASLIARFGPERSTIQQVADATGYSKAGLLHHYSSKRELQDAVFELSRAKIHAVYTSVETVPVGAVRDRMVITALLDLSLELPGVVSLMLAPLTAGDDEIAERLDGVVLSASFNGVQENKPYARRLKADVARQVDISAALGAVSVGSLLLPIADAADDLKSQLIDACMRILDHGTPA